MASAKGITNGYVDVATGLRKRNGTQFHKVLDLDNADDDYTTFWLQTGGEEFVMFLSDDATDPIQVFRISDGVSVTVNYNGNTKTYINSGTGVGKWSVLSVFDSTFIANKEVTVARTGSASDYPADYGSDWKGDFIDINDFYDTHGVPTATNEGFAFRTLNGTAGRPAGYYEVTSPHDDTAVDHLTRLVSPAANSELDEDTMPVQMVYDSTGPSFTVDTPDWESRYAGDDSTNPGPSFVGRNITELVFHRNRLWLFADEVACASATRKYFTFWINDYTNVTPDDFIDELITDEGLNTIKYAVPFSKSLNLFTNGNRQFEIRSDGPLAPDSLSILPTTAYGISDSVRPIKLGTQMYFFTPYTDYAQLYEYYYLDNAANNVAEDVTSHVKNYITEEITNMTGEVNNSMIFAHGDDTRSLYAYKMQWTGNQKAQSAWCTWTLPDNNYTIQSTRVLGDNLWFLVRSYGGSTYQWMLIKMTITEKLVDPNVPYSIHLDYSETQDGTGTYSSGTNTTYWDLNYNVESQDVVVIPLSGSKPGLSIAATTTEQSEHVTRVTVSGDYSSESVIIGIPFEFRVVLHTPYFKDNQNSPVTGAFSLKKLVLYIQDTVQFDLTQTVPGVSTPYTAPYRSTQMGASNVGYDTIPVVDFDDPSFIILGKATEMELEISDTSEFPLTLVSAEYAGTFNPRRPVR